MNKKFLSAILFGALMVTSTGTFVSCKDYDDDIENLQGQISANASAIAELKALVGNGDYVTSVTVSGHNLVVNTKNGSTTVALPECEDEVGSLAEVKGGELYIDGEATGIKVAENAEAAEFLAPVKINGDGYWTVLQEDGSYLSTGVLASSVTAVQNADKSWTLTIKDAEGNAQEVKVPSAASSLTDLILLGGVVDVDDETVSSESTEDVTLPIYAYDFVYSGDAALDDRAKWKGPRTLPANGKIMAALGTLKIQVNPTDIDATGIEFKLVDSNNGYPTNVALTASENKNMQTRAAYGNGMYTLSMADVYFKADNTTGINGFWKQFLYYGATKEYAVTAGGNVRSAYAVGVEAAEEGLELTTIGVGVNSWTIAASETVGETAGLSDSPVAKLSVDTWYNLYTASSAALYDMYVSSDEDYITLYGLEFKNVSGGWAFKVTKTPDNITKATYPIFVETVDKEGNHEKTTFWFGQSAQIANSVTYDAVTHLLSKNNDEDTSKDKNFFTIDLAKMRTALGTEGLALWNKKVASYSVTYLDANGYEVYSTNGTATDDSDDYIESTEVTEFFVTEVKTNLEAIQGKMLNTADATVINKNAKNLVFAINNETAAKLFATNKQYYAVVTFMDEDDEALNSITVPFTFTLPALSDLFVIDPGFIKDGVANLYLYADDFDGRATFKLSRVFEKFDAEGMEISLDATDVVVSDTKTAGLATLGDDADDDAEIELDADDLAMLSLTGTLGEEKGYDQVLKLYITGKYDGFWSYGDAKFNFKVKVMSPIEKGKVVAKEGNKVTIKASDLDGFKFGNSLITGYTYNNEVTYKVLPNALDTNDENAWTRNDIKAVSATSGNTRYFDVLDGDDNADNGNDAFPATEGEDEDGNEIVVDGYFQLKGYQVDHTVETTIKVKVTDIWNRSKTSEVPVKITVAE